MIEAKNSITEIWLAGGCFWGVQAFLSRLPGVIHTEVGYANGNTQNPTYEDVCRKSTGHAETVYVKFDKNKIAMEKLLDYFFRIIDPTLLNRQGNDIGIQYRTGIYYKNPEDRENIESYINGKQASYKGKILTEVLPLDNFYKAEDYHQEYLDKNPNGYCHIDLSILNEIGKE